MKDVNSKQITFNGDKVFVNGIKIDCFVCDKIVEKYKGYIIYNENYETNGIHKECFKELIN